MANRKGKFIPIKVVLQVNPLMGYKYLDRCGEFMIVVEERSSNWFATETPKPTGGKFSAPEFGYAMTVDTEKMVFGKEPWLSNHQFDHFVMEVKDLFEKAVEYLNTNIMRELDSEFGKQFLSVLWKRLNERHLRF